jgi:predicted metal-dependent hydrolase
MIHSYVREKAAWILKHRLRLQASAKYIEEAQVRRCFAEGEMLLLLGESLRLNYRPPDSGVPPRVWREGEQLCITGLPAEHPDAAARQAAVRRVIEDWYKAQALAFFSSSSSSYAQQLGLAPPRVRIGSPRQRWGSCNSRGELRFNWRLLLGPRELADYVAAHEVAHILELNHSLRFWRVVARLLPDFKARERRLDELGPALVL